MKSHCHITCRGASGLRGQSRLFRDEYAHFNPRRRGIVSIWTALLLMVLIGIMGLAIDVGYALMVAHRLQNAADAAALAGVQQVRIDPAEARQAAMDFAEANFAAGEPVLLTDNPSNDINGDIVIGRYDRATRTFRATLLGPNAVRVLARRTEDSLSGSTSLFFAPVFGVDTVQMSRHAIGMIGGGTGAGIIALNGGNKNSLTVSGTVTVNTGQGAIQVNSSHPTSAIFANGNPTINAPAINVCGEARLVGDVQFDGDLNTYPDVSPISDPLASLPEPTWDFASDLGAVAVTGGENVQIGPGYYSGGILINNGSLTLDPGIYIEDGEGLNIGGNAVFIAEGVMFYIVGQGKVDLTGTNEVRITPPTPDLYDYPGVDTYEGISFFQSRSNTNEARIIGTSLMDLEGTLYFPAANLKVGGTGEGFGNQLIADSIEISGTGDILIRYDGMEPATGNRIFLVE